jgi:hypothetical protein
MPIRQTVTEEIVKGFRRPNTIVTRGLGKRNQLVTQGYGGIFAVIKKVVTTVIAAGQSGTKRALKQLEEVIVRVRLIRVNDAAPQKSLEGFARVKIDRVRHIAVQIVEGFSARARNAWEDIKITIKRIR